METKRGLTKIQRELWGCGFALALLACGESWMVWHFGHNGCPAVSFCESGLSVANANSCLAFN